MQTYSRPAVVMAIGKAYSQLAVFQRAADQHKFSNAIGGRVSPNSFRIQLVVRKVNMAVGINELHQLFGLASSLSLRGKRLVVIGLIMPSPNCWRIFWAVSGRNGSSKSAICNR